MTTHSARRTSAPAALSSRTWPRRAATSVLFSPSRMARDAGAAPLSACDVAVAWGPVLVGDGPSGISSEAHYTRDRCSSRVRRPAAPSSAEHVTCRTSPPSLASDTSMPYSMQHPQTTTASTPSPRRTARASKSTRTGARTVDTWVRLAMVDGIPTSVDGVRSPRRRMFGARRGWSCLAPTWAARKHPSPYPTERRHMAAGTVAVLRLSSAPYPDA